MKNRNIRHQGALLFATALALSYTHQNANAGILYWDGNGTGATGNPPTANAGGAGTWDTGTTANWWNGTGYQVWNAIDGQDIADFRGTAGAVTVTGIVSANRLDIRTSNYSFAGTGTIQMVGSPAPGVIDAYTTAPTTFNALLAGSVKLQATGSGTSLSGSAVANINGNNTGLTSLEIALQTNSNPIVVNHPGAFGTSSSSLKITTGMVNLGNSAAPNNDVPISYNAVPTELAGGTIRARFNASTWNGPVTLSANSGLTTRAFANVSLTFASTATINLGTNTLSFDVASASAGITFGGVISGTGSIKADAVTGSNVTAFGTATLTAANTFSGTATTTTNRGTLALGHLNALQNATLNTGAASGTQAVTFTVAGTNTYNIGALEGSDALAIDGNTLSVGAKNSSNTFAAAISGTGGKLTKVGTGTLTLNAANTYTGATTVTSGTLALGAAGSLAATSDVAIAAGATLDVSAQTTYTHGASASLSANGTGTTLGTDAAEIKGGTTIDLGTRPLSLNFTPTAFSGDTAHPALLVSTGSLTLNGPITITNSGASPLGNGTYTLISQTSGTITGAPTISGTVGGAGLVAGKAAFIQVTGGNVELVVLDGIPTTVTLSRNVSTTSSTTYGDTLQFDVSVSPSGATGLVELRNGGISGPVIGIGTLTAGSVTITPAANALDATTHNNIVALYPGDSTYQSSASTDLSPGQVVSQKNLTVSGALANNKYFDGSTAASLSGGTLVGVVSGDESNVVLNQTGTFASSAVGTGINVTGTCTLGGSEATNYLVTQPSGLTADIYGDAIWDGSAGNLWSTAANWVDELTPAGANITADFTTLDITSDQTVNLDSARTIGNLKFGDTDNSTAAGWILANNANAANVLTLAGTSPTVTVGALDSTKSATISAIVAGTSGIAKEGSGTLTLSAANTYTGASVINTGTVRAGNASALGSAIDGTTINTGGVFDFNSVAMAGESFTLAGGKLTNNGAADQGNAANGAIVATANSRIGGLKRWDVRAGGSSLTVNSGVTLIKEDANLITVVARPFTNNGNVQIDAGSFGFHLGGTYTGPGTFTVNPGGDLQLGTFGSVTPLVLAANITSNGGSLTAADSGGGNPTFSGTITLSSATDTTLTGLAGAIISGIITGDGNIVKTNTGVHVLTAINDYTGSTTINGGELRLGNNSAINTTSSITANTGGRLGIADGITTGSTMSVAITGSGGNFFGALQGVSGTAEWQGDVVVADAPDTRIGVNTGTFTVSGVISGGSIANGVTLRPNTGTLVISGVNTWTGDTRIVCGAGGIVRLAGGSDRLPTATKLLFGLSNTSGILDLDGQDQEIAGLSVVSGTTNEVRSLTATPVLTVNTAAATPSTYSGLLTGTLGLTKKGTDMLTLSGANNYAGPTVIDAGTLLINGNQSTATGSISVNGGTLGGNGTLGGDVTVSATGTIAPGTSTGTLFVNAADLSAGGTLAIEINDASTPKCDLLDAIGDINITNAKLNVSFSGTPAELSYTIAIASSVTGTFAPANVTGLPPGYALAYTTTEIKLVKGGFDSWIGTFSGLGDITAGGDPDKDGMENLMEYVLNGNPGVSDPSILPTLDASGANFVFTFDRRLDSKDDTEQVFQYNSDLGTTWTEIAIPDSSAGNVQITPVDAVTEEVEISILKGSNTELFGRLKTVK